MKFLLPVFVTASLWAQQPAPDNTRTNERDRAKDSVTADQQKANKADTELAQKIRKAIMDDKSLSTYAHNVKVIVQNGEVTLKGPVRSGDERDIIAKKAGDIAGATHVVNQMDVAPAK